LDTVPSSGSNPVFLPASLVTNALTGADRVTGTGHRAGGQVEAARFDNSRFFMSLGDDKLMGSGDIR